MPKNINTFTGTYGSRVGDSNIDVKPAIISPILFSKLRTWFRKDEYIPLATFLTRFMFYKLLFLLIFCSCLFLLFLWDFLFLTYFNFLFHFYNGQIERQNSLSGALWKQQRALIRTEWDKIDRPQGSIDSVRMHHGLYILIPCELINCLWIFFILSIHFKIFIK